MMQTILALVFGSFLFKNKQRETLSPLVEQIINLATSDPDGWKFARPREPANALPHMHHDEQNVVVAIAPDGEPSMIWLPYPQHLNSRESRELMLAFQRIFAYRMIDHSTSRLLK